MADSGDRVTVRTYPDYEELSRAAASDLVEDIGAALQSQETYALALAGGGTPERLYEVLAAEAGEMLPWDQIHLFWGDERYVPHDHPKSNACLARETLIDAVPIPESNVHPMPTMMERPEAAADRYAATLQEHVPSRSRTFDTVLLGLGTDGHTASLFPETFTPAGTDAWVEVVSAPPRHDVSTRLTCTLPVLNGSRRALFLVSGRGKRKALRRVLDQRDRALPPTHVAPREKCLWYVDIEARPGGEGPSGGAA